MATASGCSEVPGEPGDIYADADAVSEAVRAAGEPFILCGHFYAGTVITEAGAGEPDVRHLTYITPVLPDLGQSRPVRSEQLQELFSRTATMPRSGTRREGHPNRRTLS
ncbi:MAG TPA: hypothetical protein VFW64_12690 [Pseudonocardiaceae bacterium]|nr:hypothetical protein [Pseudonocardiaceae bacterium]